ncbi:thiol reductant ABC exporter subunit CydD [Thioclava sp. GXIMD4216]|uniref:thiol reductant ABC exporter subunit CydD n=1 Tax=Thioclava sp. GXIMD4216 TaxID=3131929 RepID=UPI0030D14693
MGHSQSEPGREPGRELTGEPGGEPRGEAGEASGASPAADEALIRARRGRKLLRSLMMPEQRQLRTASGLSVLAALVWPLQALLVAHVLGGLLLGRPSDPLRAALVFLALGALRAGLGWAAEHMAQRAANQVLHRLRLQIVAQEASCGEESAFGGAGAIAALAAEKTDLLKPYITRYMPAQFRVAVVPLLFLALALWPSWAVAVIFAISGPLIPVFMALVGMAAKEASMRQLDEVGSLNDLLVERLGAVLDIRVLGAQKQVMAGFEAQTGRLRQRTMAVLRVAFLSSTVLELFSAIGVAMVAVFVGFSLLGEIGFGTWGRTLSPEAGIFLLLIAPEFYQPLRDLSAAWHDRASAEAVGAEIEDWMQARPAPLIGSGGQATPVAGRCQIAATGLVVHGRALPDLHLSPGESVALVGPSGSGKTTLLRLVAGILQPDAGRIDVAGQALVPERADGWRARLGWMPQTPHFLSGSLRDSLMLPEGADPWPALERAGVAHVVRALPEGLETTLGETGGGLSGGEARRIMLARALARTPDLLLADEPTADLDEETARLVSDGILAAHAGGMGVLVATHDMALAQRMDRIIRLEDGL